MSIDGLTSENCLFLICPTDGMELLLAKRFKGQAFFYTALGACFEWDLATQEWLTKLIRKRNIGQIVLLVKRCNTFIADKNKMKFNLAHYPVEKNLQFIEDSVAEHLEHWDTLFLKGTVLAAKYLEHQKERLLKTLFLGQLTESDCISITGLLYDEQSNQFYKTEKLIYKIALFETISIN